jgi:hypothetical protein
VKDLLNQVGVQGHSSQHLCSGSKPRAFCDIAENKRIQIVFFFSIFRQVHDKGFLFRSFAQDANARAQCFVEEESS